MAKKKTLTAAQKRGLGKGWAKPLDMEDAYLPEKLAAQREHKCREDGEVVPCLGPEECVCLCHDTWKMLNKFSL